MSRYYKIHCPSHDEISEGINHGADRLNDLWRIRYLYPIVYEASFIGITLDAYPENDVMRFIQDHKDCECVIRDEYNEPDTDLTREFYKAEIYDGQRD